MKKLTIADIKATETLSKDERKMVVGGSDVVIGSGPKDDYKITGGKCTNENVRWTYSPPVSYSTCQDQIARSCHDKVGTCTFL